MAAERDPVCPLCDFPLSMPECYCTQCEMTLSPCPNCGRYHPPWLSTCPYCHTTIAIGRAYEVADAVRAKHPTVSPKTKQVTTSRRMRHLDAAVAVPVSPESADREAPEFPASDGELPRHTRVDYLSGNVDTEADAERDALRQAMDEQQLKMDEKINPRWIDSQASGPAILLVVALLMWSETGRYGVSNHTWDGILLFPFILAGIAILWFAAIVIIDRLR